MKNAINPLVRINTRLTSIKRVVTIKLDRLQGQGVTHDEMQAIFELEIDSYKAIRRENDKC